MSSIPHSQLNININYNILNKYSQLNFKRSNLDVNLNNLEQFPYFTDVVEYPISILNNMTYIDCVKFFFDISVFNNTLLPYYDNAKEITLDEITRITEFNIMNMIRLLFPTNFPIVNNITNSLNFINKTKSTYPLFINPLKRIDHSHLKIKSNTYTINKVIWINDIINHPIYNKLLHYFNDFNIWYNTNSDKLITILNNYFNNDKKNIPTQVSQFIERIQTFSNKFKSNNKLQSLINNKNSNSLVELISILNKIYNNYILSNKDDKFKLNAKDKAFLQIYTYTNNDNDNIKYISLVINLFDTKITSENFDDINCSLKEQIINNNEMYSKDTKYWSVYPLSIINKQKNIKNNTEINKHKLLQKFFDNLVINNKNLKSKFKNSLINSDSFINYLLKQPDSNSKILIQLLNIILTDGLNIDISTKIDSLLDEIKHKLSLKNILYKEILLALKKNDKKGGCTKKNLKKRKNKSSKV
tara:strand:+ start:423 stop:1838 length:1416 start_codon:yes stop_codon:yes gene_type:complete